MRMVSVIIFVMLITTLACQGHCDAGWANRTYAYPDVKVSPLGTIEVMVIDTGVQVDHPMLFNWIENKYDASLTDHHGHGTHITGIILYGNHMYDHKDEGLDGLEKNHVCAAVRIHECKYFDPTNLHQDNIKSTIACVKEAIRLRMNAINYSSGGTSPNQEEFDVFKAFIKMGGIVTTAAGNEHGDLDINPYFPASYGHFPLVLSKDMLKIKGLEQLPRIYAVQNVDLNGKKVQSSNKASLSEYGDGVYSTLPGNNFGYMTGTSQAAASYLHDILIQKCERLENDKWN